MTTAGWWSSTRAAAAILSLLVPGCASIDVVTAGELNGHRMADGTTPVAHVRASNWGWYLFKFIPIWTGNLDHPEYPQLCDWFTDNVTVHDVVSLATEKGRELGGTVTTDLRTTDKSAYQFWTLFFWLNEIEVSANFSAE